MATPPQIVTLGSLNMDVVVRVQRHPLPGETLLGSPYQTFAGGKGANQALAAAKAGGESLLVGCIGEDAFGEQLLAELQAGGVNVAGVDRVDGPSGIALIVVDERGQNSIVVSPGANAQMHPERLMASSIPSLFDSADLLMLQLEIPIATVRAAMEKATRHGVPVLLNPAPAQALSPEVLQRVTYLVVNESEAALLTQREPDSIQDISSALSAARSLASTGVKTVIVTLGAQGVAWVHSNEYKYMPALSVETIDTTAAGDAFCGALAVKLGEGASLDEAIAFANAAGALAVTRQGAQASLGNRSEIEALLNGGIPQTPKS